MDLERVISLEKCYWSSSNSWAFLAVDSRLILSNSLLIFSSYVPKAVVFFVRSAFFVLSLFSSFSYYLALRSKVSISLKYVTIWLCCSWQTCLISDICLISPSRLLYLFLISSNSVILALNTDPNLSFSLLAPKSWFSSYLILASADLNLFCQFSVSLLLISKLFCTFCKNC